MVVRDFKKDPITDDELLNSYWYTVIDDLIGGWAIATANARTGDLDYSSGEFEVGSFLTKSACDRIVSMHNWQIQDLVWETYQLNVWAAQNRDATLILDMMRLSD